MAKALLVLDQVPWSELARMAARRGWPAPARVQLPYVPRTTPVGHATLSTGLNPCDHRVQGRRWYVRNGRSWDVVDLDDLPRASGFPSTIGARLRAHSLASRLRSDPRTADDPIVIVAAKAFIPFLFGAWDADFVLYPLDTRPDRATGQLSVVVEAFAPRASKALVVIANAITFLMKVHASSWSPESHVDARNGTSPRGNSWLELVWTLPPSQRRGSGWSELMRNHARSIDTFYTLLGTDLLDALAAPAVPSSGVLLQSWFSTDLMGHLCGHRSAEYELALHSGCAIADALASARFRVLITSDHGGRVTPNHLACNSSPPPGSSSFLDSHGAPITGLPPHGTPAPYVSGDHVVTYGAYPCTAPMLHYWDGAHLQRAAPRPGGVSFHPDQVPEWLLLPRDDEQFSTSFGRGRAGGSHGACVDVGPPAQLSDVDAEVPALVLGPGAAARAPATLARAPATLAGIASTFARL